MKLFYSFLFSFIVIGSIVILPVIIFKLKNLKTGNKLIETKKEILITWFIASFLYGLLIYLIISNKNPSDTFLLFMNILIVSFFTLYSYFIIPIQLLFYKNIKRHRSLESWIRTNHTSNVKIYIINTNVKNAYAIGMIPFAKMILIGKPIFEKMDENDIKGILLHELGHTKMKHVAKLFSLNLAACIVFAILNYYISPHILKTVKYGIILAAFRGLLFGLLIWSISYFQRNLEFSADIFAASKIGKFQYISTLNKLYRLANNKNKGKWVINYPTLQKRIDNVYSNTKK